MRKMSMRLSERRSHGQGKFSHRGENTHWDKWMGQTSLCENAGLLRHLSSPSTRAVHALHYSEKRYANVNGQQCQEPQWQQTESQDQQRYRCSLRLLKRRTEQDFEYLGDVDNWLHRLT
jgi:hypothetical protein